MEKLTEYVDGKYIRIKGTKSLYPKNERDGAPLSNAIARLAAYEETGLEPEEIRKFLEDVESRFVNWINRHYGIPVIDFIDIMEAKNDGRLVVLPCDVGDTVYVIDPGDYEHEYKPYIRSKTVSEINWKATRKKDLGWGLILAGGNCGTKARYKLNNVGKTVFLTREAAEAALKEKECMK